MDRVKAYKLKGGTLIEVILASLIISIVFGISLLIYLNIINKNNSISQTRAKWLVQNEMNNLKHHSVLNLETKNFDNITITKEVLPYTLKNIYEVKVVALMNNNEIYKSKKLIYLPN